MLTYLVILLDDTSVSYCHYDTGRRERRLIPLDVLKRGIVWAMKENLNIQFVYPDYPLPQDYRETVEMIDHMKIGPAGCGEALDVVVVDDLSAVALQSPTPFIWQCSLAELDKQKAPLKDVLRRVQRLNVMLTDVVTWRQAAFDTYKAILEDLAAFMAERYREGSVTQLNLLTDRLFLSAMNNCGAGDTSVTLAPDGRFYVCPAFYYAASPSIGSPESGLDIPNRQLYRLDHAPICRLCDAYQCRRCVWLNGELTGDANTPSHEQCVAAHLERNASRQLQLALQEHDVTLENSNDIKELDYLDPFNIANKWK